MTPRQSEILELLRRDGQVTVDDLASRFQVTLQTIRRDLTELAEDGRLERVHGGAIRPSGTVNIAYLERQDLNAADKAKIAALCAARIPDGSTLFLNIGTTIEAVARALSGHRDLLVVTNNLNVATILQTNPGVDVVVTGGVLRPSDGGLLGPIAASSVANYRLDIAVIGCSAVDPTGDLMDFDLAEVEVSKSMIRQARKSILVADHSKLTRTAPIRITHLSEVDEIITDRPLPQVLASESRAWKTEIIYRPLAEKT